MTRQGRKPCGQYHALPCGLDKVCPVPVEFHDAGKNSHEIYQDWRSSRVNGSTESLK